MADYSWIAPATKNIANLFGLNPEAAAKGRNMQADYDYTLARTANTQADTGLSDPRRRLLEAQAATQTAQAGKYGADTRFRDTQTGGLAEQQRQLKIAQQFINDNFTMDASGRPVPKPGTLGQTMAAVIGAGGIQNVSKSGQVIGDYGLIAAPSSREANLAAGGANATAAAKPTFAGTNEQAAGIRNEGYDAAQSRGVEVAKAGRIAAALAKGQAGPNQTELNAQAAGNKLGAEFALSIPFNGSYLDEAQANQLSQAARAANPSLNPQDAVMKFVNDNPGMLQNQEGSFWWSKDKVKIPGGIPVTLPATRPQGISGSFGQPAAPGNIDLNNRPVLKNPNGSISTESSISIGIDGKEVLIPTIVNGQRVSNQQAIEHFKQTGQHLGIFNTVDEANAYAQSLHNRQGAAYAPPQYQPGQGMPPYRQVQGPSAQAPATAEPARITNDDSGKAAYARLPSGTPFVDPNGQRRIKP